MMKHKLLSSLFLITVLSSCGRSIKDNDQNGTSASSISLHDGDERYLKIDPGESVITWKGAMLIGTNAHSGYVYVSKGELMIENNRLIGGAAEVDMNTIEDQAHKSDNGLIKHLKDPDFFDVKKFPTATLSIIKVESKDIESKQITGNLTIKGITQPVSFPAKVEMLHGKIEAIGKLVIDRTKWGIRYKSGKFYALVADQTMSDSIRFEIKIVGKR